MVAVTDIISKRKSRAAVTFEGGLDASFHRWFRLTPSFSPQLVDKWLDRFVDNVSPVLLDPFAGAGTTAIVAKSRGLDSIGVEINPFLAFVGNTCVDWSVSPALLKTDAETAVSYAQALVSEGPIDPEEFALSLGVTLPPIHNVSRWWRDHVLRQIVALRHAIGSADETTASHLRLALGQITYSTANITLGRLQVAFIDRSTHTIEVFDPFLFAVMRMVDDLVTGVPAAPGESKIINADSTRLDSLQDGTIGAVFTSPPYPNRYSYVWNTRPHLYLLEFFTTPKEAAELDRVTIGGTWGSATSSLQKGLIEPSRNVANALGSVLEQLHTESVLMGNYVTKYFNDLDTHIAALKPKLKVGAPVGYVVGNSESKGIMIETHDALASLFSAHGFSNIEQEILRKRNSGAGLTEVTVSALNR